MEDRETARMHKYGESKTTRIMMATVPHVTSSLGLRKFQADGFLLTWVYQCSTATLKMEAEGSSETLYVRTKPHGITPKKTNFMHHVLDSVLAYLMILFQLSRT